jgi:cytochrome c
MSAHPQLSVKQASEIVSYILSVKDEGKNTLTVPPSGVIRPDKSGGEYILSVTYQDKERMGIEANTVKKNFHFKSPRLKAVASDDDKAVAKLGESVVRFTENGSWLLFKNIDLTNIGTVLFFVDPSGIGGKLALRLGSPTGQEIGTVSIPQPKGKPKAGAAQKNNHWTTVQIRPTPRQVIMIFTLSIPIRRMQNRVYGFRSFWTGSSLENSAPLCRKCGTSLY